jgi:NAD/NADP transhydrogenase alpha subunit
MALFAKQASEVDIIITTALIREFSSSDQSPELMVLAGEPAPKLILKEHVEVMRREMSHWAVADSQRAR